MLRPYKPVWPCTNTHHCQRHCRRLLHPHSPCLFRQQLDSSSLLSPCTLLALLTCYEGCGLAADTQHRSLQVLVLISALLLLLPGKGGMAARSCEACEALSARVMVGKAQRRKGALGTVAQSLAWCSFLSPCPLPRLLAPALTPSSLLDQGMNTAGLHALPTMSTHEAYPHPQTALLSQALPWLPH